MARPSKHPKITFECQNCGVHKTVYANPNQSFKFCTRKCYLENKARETVILVCKYCGCKKRVSAQEVVRGHYTEYCGRVCRNAAIGKRNFDRRGGYWKKIRQSILERDHHTCKLCNKNTATQVHHIVPFKDFAGTEAANKDENLISLCVPCHKLTYCHEYDYVDKFQRIIGELKNG